MKRTNLKGLSLKDLEEFVISISEKRFRGGQLFDWLYNKEVETFDEMTTMSKSLRAKLKETASIDSINLLTFHRSSDDKTTKFLFELSDGKKIESVLIPPRTAFENNSAEDEDEQKRLTLCVSTQVGCPLDCVFCATGTMGFHRNLTSCEIIDQYQQVKKITGKKITNIVFMGMGEPLLNYENVMNSIDIFSTGMSVAARRITLSTAGWVDGIIRMADEKKKVKLAVSLHSLNDKVRTELMPLNKKFNLQELLEAIQYYYRKTKMRVTFEYILFSGTNDSAKDIKDIIKLSKSVPCKINIIPFHRIDFANPTEPLLKLTPVSFKDTEKFAQTLRRNHVSVFIRSSAGEDIAAACGQLIGYSNLNIADLSIV
ncbi:MAG: 23S rRNA (adenine(2503)-C(2))-methyltransferase RlmN [Bacteroidetes bacterium]|nr:23S rRNA (adenine(2503)-C(2))-methyltransferase RlmN [Bacteroidota bacterium]MBU1422339.1 23S rRNA (adenine(2503)-C(2))-methyltransferase RlmN [Bacteroidota bacterium]